MLSNDRLLDSRPFADLRSVTHHGVCRDLSLSVDESATLRISWQ